MRLWSDEQKCLRTPKGVEDNRVLERSQPVGSHFLFIFYTVQIIHIKMSFCVTVPVIFFAGFSK